MKLEAEENYSLLRRFRSSVSDILGGAILASAVFVVDSSVDSSRMTRMFDPAEAV
jgi:hypothetical protein